MPVGDTRSLFGQILVLVAHQDDETACSVLLQRARQAWVVFATDGAPASEFFWRGYGTRDQYAAARYAEAVQSLGVIGIPEAIFLQDPANHAPFHDQELYRSLTSAITALEDLAGRLKPDALVTPAYEGGHPDHDACSFLANVIADNLSIPVWEMPLYHRSPDGALVHQEFRIPVGGEILLRPSQSELLLRDQMLSKYISQPDASKFVSALVERFRPQPGYDYSRPPHPGALNYEFWGWPVTGFELCAAFESYRPNSKRGLRREASWAGCSLSKSEAASALQS